MASSVAKFHIVRCPKCRKLLMEFADVPVYKCGGCGAVLQAKHHNASGGIASRDSPEVSKPQMLSDNEPSNNVAIPSETEMVSGFPSQQTLGMEFEADENYQKNYGSIENDERVETDARYSLDKEVEKPPELGRQDSGCSKMSGKLKKSEDTLSQSVSSDEDMIISRIQAYDGSVSSSDDGSRDQGLNKFLDLSRRTFRRQRVPDSACDKTEKEMNDLSSDVEDHIEDDRQLELNASNEGHRLDSKGRFHSNCEDSPSKHATHAYDRGTSIDSQEFYSAQNMSESEKDGHPRTIPRDSTLIPNTVLDQNIGSPTKFKGIEHDRLELLRKVNELRNQLSGLSNQKVKKNGYVNSTGLMHDHYPAHKIHPCPSLDLNRNDPGVHYRNQQCQLSRTLISEQTCCSCPPCIPSHSCCHSGSCQSCPHNICHHSSEILHSHSFKKKKVLAKRHSRPMFGGAPFVICTKCFAVLQLPADFLISKKKLQKLQCGSCSEVLAFTFHSRAHAVAMPPKEAVHPPSEVEDNAGVLVRSKVSSACIQGNPVSFTEEYGLSFDQSYSTEVEPGSHVSRKNSVERVERNDRLHKLMGSRSARELLNKRSYSIRSEKMESHVLYNYSAGKASPDFINGSCKGDESPTRLRTKRVSPQLQGIVKKGMRELNPGFESLKLKVTGDV